MLAGSLGSPDREYTSNACVLLYYTIGEEKERKRESERNRVTSRECDLSPRIKDDVAQNYKRHAVPSVDRIRRQERRNSSPALPCREYRTIAPISARPFNRDVGLDVANRNEIRSHSSRVTANNVVMSNSRQDALDNYNVIITLLCVY